MYYKFEKINHENKEIIWEVKQECSMDNLGFKLTIRFL